MDVSPNASDGDAARKRENEARWARLRALSDAISANWPRDSARLTGLPSNEETWHRPSGRTRERLVAAPVRRIDIHDFPGDAEQFIRELRETGSDIIVTADGESVAVIRPYTEEDGESVDLRHDLALLGRLEKLSESSQSHGHQVSTRSMRCLSSGSQHNNVS